VHADKRAMLQDLTASLQQSPSESRLLHELARCICSAVDADGYNLFLIDPTTFQLRIDYESADLKYVFKNRSDSDQKG